jgi:hypothetical protein
VRGKRKPEREKKKEGERRGGRGITWVNDPHTKLEMTQIPGFIDSYIDINVYAHVGQGIC